MPLLLPKYSFGRGIAAPLPINTLKLKHWGGRGAACPPQEEARPPHIYPWLRQNLVRANFA